MQFYKKIKEYRALVFPLLIGIACLWVPLIRNFHIESALLAAVVGCFWAGWKAAGPLSRERGDARQAMSILGSLYLFGLPLLIHSLWTGCFSVYGLGFWLLYPIPSVFFGYAIGRLIRKWRLPFGRWLTTLVLILIAVGVLAVEFFNLPQVYFFNHVWGGWPGPIYDETVPLTGSLFYFRFLTLLWILFLWYLPDFEKDKQVRWIVIGCAVALALGYTQLPQAGIISPPSYIQLRLGGFKETPHFKLFYDKANYDSSEINMIAKEHEFYLDEITHRLHLAKPDSLHKINSYLYAHAWQKKKLTGAKFTSYVPVWLKQDQLHIAKQQLGSLKHELVHVTAKRFGNGLFHASWSIGLVEGLAVALAPSESPTSTIDQIVVSEPPLPTAGEMKKALSPLGFYGGRTAVSYITSGSFVAYLLRSYPVEDFKQAYRTANIEASYPVSFSKLVQGWHAHLDSVSVDSTDLKTASFLFGIPSLFEQECPHTVTAFGAAWDRYHLKQAEKNTAAMLRNLDDALNAAPENMTVKSEWAFQHLKAGDLKEVQQKASFKDSLIDAQLLYADAFALGGDQHTAGSYLNEAIRRLAQEPDSTYDAAIATRADPQQWSYYLDMTYRGRLFDKEMFAKVFYRTKIRTLQQAIDREKWDLVDIYVRELLQLPADKKYVSSYLTVIHLLGFRGEAGLAQSWVQHLGTIALRARQQQRLEEQRRWLRFLSSGKSY